MAVKSKADKTGGHKSSGLKAVSYAQTSAPPAGASGGTVLGTAGTKALMFRAKKELGPLEDPNQSIAD
jgi:hypothetical protein